MYISTYKYSHIFVLFFVEFPKISPFPSPRKYLTEDYSVSFVCKAKGIPAPKYTWYFQGNQINTVGNNLIKDGNLTITKVTSSSKGQYRCKAYNEIKKPGKTAVEIGEDTKTVEIVDVYGKENIRTIVVVQMK